MSKIKKALLSEQRQKLREELIQKYEADEASDLAIPRRGRPEGPSFSDCWKAYKDTPEYRQLEEEIRNRRFVVEHLIWRAYSAGFKARNGRKAEKEEA